MPIWISKQDIVLQNTKLEQICQSTPYFSNCIKRFLIEHFISFCDRKVPLKSLKQAIFFLPIVIVVHYVILTSWAH
jgi:hypothetical protein